MNVLDDNTECNQNAKPRSLDGKMSDPEDGSDGNGEHLEDSRPLKKRTQRFLRDQASEDHLAKGDGAVDQLAQVDNIPEESQNDDVVTQNTTIDDVIEDSSQTNDEEDNKLTIAHCWSESPKLMKCEDKEHFSPVADIGDGDSTPSKQTMTQNILTSLEKKICKTNMMLPNSSVQERYGKITDIVNMAKQALEAISATAGDEEHVHCKMEQL